MDTLNFLKEFELIEKRLISEFPDFKGKRFFELLEYLENKRIFNDSILFLLQEILGARNRLLGKSQQESISGRDWEMLNMLKKELKL